MDTQTNTFTGNTWTKRLEWEPLTEFKSGNVSATVNILRIRIPEYSYRIVTLHPNGALKGSFVQYKVDDLPFDHHLRDVLKVVEEAHNFIKEKMALHKAEAEQKAAEEAKQREAALTKEAENRTKKVNKKSKYLANKEQRREQNRSTRHGSGGGGKKKGQS